MHRMLLSLLSLLVAQEAFGATPVPDPPLGRIAVVGGDGAFPFSNVQDFVRNYASGAGAECG